MKTLNSEAAVAEKVTIDLGKAKQVVPKHHISASLSIASARSNPAKDYQTRKGTQPKTCEDWKKQQIRSEQ